MDLSDIRAQIDAIDTQLLQLFLKRMDCSAAVAEYKAAHQLPVLNAQREQEILDTLAAKSGDRADAVRLLYSTIMDISRAAQYGKVNGDSPLRSKIAAAQKASFAPRSVVCQGVPGAYSHVAAQKLYPDAKLAFVTTFEDVFKTVAQGGADCGVVPIENSYAGSVVENYDHLKKYGLSINAAINLPVSHCLLTGPGATLDTVTTVYSHPQGILQCADFIARHGLDAKPMRNTAVAAQSVAQEPDNQTIAAIASEQAAAEYGLNVLQRDIQSSDCNSTRFVVVAKEMWISPDADHVSIAFPLPHVAGSLYRTLSKLAAMGLNLTKIESRPMKSSPFTYLFYLDFCANLSDEKALELLCGMHEELPDFELLGNYRIL